MGQLIQTTPSAFMGEVVAFFRWQAYACAGAGRDREDQCSSLSGTKRSSTFFFLDYKLERLMGGLINLERKFLPTLGTPSVRPC